MENTPNANLEILGKPENFFCYFFLNDGKDKEISK